MPPVRPRSAGGAANQTRCLSLPFLTLVMQPVESALRRDGDEGRLVEIGIGDRRHEVGRAWTKGRKANPGFACQPSPHAGNEPGALLVPARHELDLRVFQREQKIFGLLARHPEDEAHAFALETSDDEIGDFHIWSAASNLNIANCYTCRVGRSFTPWRRALLR